MVFTLKCNYFTGTI